MKKFLLADDHAIVRTGISFLIRQDFPTAEIDECADGDGVWKKVNTRKYDLLVLDINMPETDPVTLLKNIAAIHPDQKVLILTMNREEIYAKKYLQLNTRGFINKDADPSQLRKAIATILDNRTYLSPWMQERLLSEALNGESKHPFEALTSRELEIVRHLVEGKTTKEISGILSIHTSTVGSYKGTILQKLGLSNMVELSHLVQAYPMH